MIQQIEFLKAENEMLRARVTQKWMILKPAEQDRLIELGKKLGTKLKELITVVTYGTFLKWLRDKQSEEDRKTSPGLPRRSANRLFASAQKPAGGYTRTMGEMKKLGIKPPSRTTLKKILQEHGFDPLAEHSNETWKEFLERRQLQTARLGNCLRLPSRRLVEVI